MIGWIILCGNKHTPNSVASNKDLLIVHTLRHKTVKDSVPYHLTLGHRMMQQQPLGILPVAVTQRNKGT